MSSRSLGSAELATESHTLADAFAAARTSLHDVSRRGLEAEVPSNDVDGLAIRWAELADCSDLAPRLRALSSGAFADATVACAQGGCARPEAVQALQVVAQSRTDDMSWADLARVTCAMERLGAGEADLRFFLSALVPKLAPGWEDLAGPAVGLLELLEAAEKWPPAWSRELLQALEGVPSRQFAEVLEWNLVDCGGDKEVKQDVAQRRVVRSLVRLLNNVEMKDARALLAGFEVLNKVWDDGSASVRAMLLQQGQLHELFDRALQLGMRNDRPDGIDEIHPQLYFSTLTFVHVARAHELCVPELAPLCLAAAGLPSNGIGDVSGRNYHVLDYGCGPGTWAVPLAQALGPGSMVTCVDADKMATDVAWHWAEKSDMSERVWPTQVVPDMREVESFLDGKTFDVLFICDICRYLAHARKDLWPTPYEAFYRANLGYWRRIRSHITGSPLGVHVVSLEKPNLAEALRGVLERVGFRDVTTEHIERVPNLNKFSMWPPHVIRLWARNDSSDLGVPDARPLGEPPMPSTEIPQGVRELTPDYCLP